MKRIKEIIKIIDLKSMNTFFEIKDKDNSKRMLEEIEKIK